MSMRDMELSVLDALSTAVLMLDESRRVVIVNTAAEDLLASSRLRLAGTALDELFAQPAMLDAAIDHALDGPQTITVRGLVVFGRSGERCQSVDCTVSPAPSEATGNVLLELVSAESINQLVREDSYYERQVSQRNMLRGIAHEVKNPLGGIRGAAQLLDGQLKDRNTREYTRIIIHEVDRLANLLDRMAMSNQPSEKKIINVYEFIEPVRKLISAEAGPGINVERDYDPSLPMITGSTGSLEQALLNIARNAVKAVGKRGTVRFRTRITRRMTIGLKHHRQLVRIDVIDSGPGVDEALRAHIFEPMVTGYADGTGLGLSIARDIVGHHGGMILFERENELTCFSVFLPVDGAAHE